MGSCAGLPFRLLPVLLGIFLICCSGVQAIDPAPSIPHTFYGVVYIQGQPAPAGLVVEARGTGVQNNSEQNPIMVQAGGLYGGPGTFDSKLTVQGYIATGTPIEFYVNGTRAQCMDVLANTSWQNTYPFRPAKMTRLNLKVNLTLVQSIPGYGLPTDPNNDTIYEDVNANSRIDFNDVVLYFKKMEWIAANEPIPCFDYNGNGRIDFNDVVRLFGKV